MERLILNSVPEKQQKQVTRSNIISALSYALDLTEGARPGHAVRTCILGMKIGLEIGLSEDLLAELYYALLLKDVGCSSNAARLFQIVGDDEIRAKRLTHQVDWTRFEWKQMRYMLKYAHAKEPPLRRLRRVSSMFRRSRENAEELIRLRCEKGARVVRDLGLGAGTAGAIHCLDEHWDGSGYPDSLSGEDIPLLARIATVAQTLEVFYRMYGAPAALAILKRRSARWFDPILVKAVMALDRKDLLWQGCDDASMLEYVQRLEPQSKDIPLDSFVIDNICFAFAAVVDAKSHYTYTHSSGVANVAVKMGQALDLNPREITTLRRAGLLHDIGKLSVPNSILDKKGSLDESEWTCVRRHPYYTYEILNRIAGFEGIARVAATHHEKLDGSGYHVGLGGDALCLLSRILTVADMFDALSGERPYREKLSLDQVLGILKKDTPHALDPRCFAALETVAEDVEVVAC